MIRDRITEFLTTLATNIFCSKGGVLLGRSTSGSGRVQEIDVGTGLSLVDNTLSSGSYPAVGNTVALRNSEGSGRFISTSNYDYNGPVIDPTGVALYAVALNSGRAIFAEAVDGFAINGKSISSTGVKGSSASGYGVFGASASETGVFATSQQKTGLEVNTDSGNYSAIFRYGNQPVMGITGDRANFVWFYNGFTGNLAASDFTANRNWTLPDASGYLVATPTPVPTNVATALAKPIGTLGAVQLNGDTVTPAAIVLPDVTTVSPPIGSLGLRRGQLSVGNGATVGGVLATPRNVKGMFQFDTTTQPITGADARIVSLPIYPEDLTYLDGSGFPKYTMYGEITLSNDSYSSNIKDWGIGFAFNDDSLLPKSNAKWIYGSLHPAAGTAKNLTWMAAKLRAKSRLYLSSGVNLTFYTPDPAFTPYGVTYGTGADNVISYPVRTMPNQSGTQILSKTNGGLLWLMVHAEKMTGEPVGGVITVNYDLTLEFP